MLSSPKAGKATRGLMNRNMDDLREEFELKKSCPRKLRGLCKNYRGDNGA